MAPNRPPSTDEVGSNQPQTSLEQGYTVARYRATWIAPWRRYPPAPDVLDREAGEQCPDEQEPDEWEASPEDWERERERSRAWQAERVEVSGFACSPELSERSWRIHAQLMRRGHGWPAAYWLAQLAAVSGRYNFRGNPRIAQHCGHSLRTSQRRRLAAETAGLITSHLVVRGQRVPGMRRAVRRTQVVRDVSRVQALADLPLSISESAAAAAAPEPADTWWARHVRQVSPPPKENRNREASASAAMGPSGGGSATLSRAATASELQALLLAGRIAPEYTAWLHGYAQTRARLEASQAAAERGSDSPRRDRPLGPSDGSDGAGGAVSEETRARARPPPPD